MTPFTDFGSHWNETNLGKLEALQSQVTFTRATSDAPYQQPAQLSGIIALWPSTQMARYFYMIPIILVKQNICTTSPLPKANAAIIP